MAQPLSAKTISMHDCKEMNMKMCETISNDGILGKILNLYIILKGFLMIKYGLLTSMKSLYSALEVRRKIEVECLYFTLKCIKIT